MATQICRECKREYESASHYNRWCPECRGIEVKRRGRRFEEDHRHPCPGCGTSIARTSANCRSCSTNIRAENLRGEKNYAWKGGVHRDNKGYVHLRVAPSSRKRAGYRPEHHIVWEQANGEPLPKGWVVHHLNGLKDDNRPENLAAMSRSEHNHAHGQRRIRELETENARLRERLGGLEL